MTELTPDLLLRAYAMGVFPMAESSTSDTLHWIEPQMRGIFPLAQFRISRSLRKALLRNDYSVHLNRDFSGCMEACADRDETWINDQILHAYGALHARGHAHSVEVWSKDQMIGGVYGVALGAAFFGESMFSRRRDGSKIALAWLVARLRYGGFTLFDTQFITDHLASLGAVEVPRANFQALLHDALHNTAQIDAMPLDADARQVFQRNPVSLQAINHGA